MDTACLLFQPHLISGLLCRVPPAPARLVQPCRASAFFQVREGRLTGWTQGLAWRLGLSWTAIPSGLTLRCSSLHSQSVWSLNPLFQQENIWGHVQLWSQESELVLKQKHRNSVNDGLQAPVRGYNRWSGPVPYRWELVVPSSPPSWSLKRGPTAWLPKPSCFLCLLTPSISPESKWLLCSLCVQLFLNSKPFYESAELQTSRLTGGITWAGEWVGIIYTPVVTVKAPRRFKKQNLVKKLKIKAEQNAQSRRQFWTRGLQGLYRWAEYWAWVEGGFLFFCWTWKESLLHSGGWMGGASGSSPIPGSHRPIVSLHEEFSVALSTVMHHFYARLKLSMQVVGQKEGLAWCCLACPLVDLRVSMHSAWT